MKKFRKFANKFANSLDKMASIAGKKDDESKLSQSLAQLYAPAYASFLRVSLFET